MAKVMNPLISSEARGRVQGIVYNTWRGTRYAKTQTAPAQPRTQTQLQIRAWMVELVRLWQTLGSTVMTDWNDYATAHPDIDWTNSSKRITGLNWYTRCNMRLKVLAMTLITEPPAVAAPASLVSWTAQNGILSSRQIWEAAAGTNLTANFRAYGPHSAGVSGKINKAVDTAFQPGQTPDFTISGLRPGTYTLFARYIDEATGLASAWLSRVVTITAA